MDREPYNPKYCKEVKCHLRKGNKCTVEECVRNHKQIVYWEAFDVLATGDVPDA